MGQNFIVGEVDVVNEVSLAPSAVIYDGAVTADDDLFVKVNAFFYDLAGTKGRYAGAVAQAVAASATNFIYVGAGGLVINTTGYPTAPTAHIRLARVITNASVILRILHERAFFGSNGTLSGSSADDTLVFGAGGVGTTTTDRFMPFGYTPWSASATSLGILAARGGILSNLRVQHNTPGLGGSIVYTLYRNNVVTTLTCSLNASGTSASDLVNTVLVTAGDILDLRATKPSAISTSPQGITATIEFNA